MGSILKDFANAIDDSIGAHDGDDLRKAAQRVVNSKVEKLDNIEPKWRGGDQQGAANLLEGAIGDAGEIERAVGCLQDAITSGVRPPNCVFPIPSDRKQ